MALIHCPECGREISDQAAACPGCGYPLGAADPPASQEADRQRRLEEARARDRQFLKKAGVLLLLGIALILGLVILLARTNG